MAAKDKGYAGTGEKNKIILIRKELFLHSFFE
jgi:hypothetical protein